MSDDYDIHDVKYDSTTAESGKINFRKNKKPEKMKSIIKTIIFILISVIAGGLAGAYITNKQVGYLYPGDDKALFDQKSSESSNMPKNSITKVSEVVSPAVVGISNTAEGFFGSVSKGSGSGIIFDKNGYIVTNYHVIENASAISIKLSTGKVLKATVVGLDPKTDLAVIKVDAKNLPTAKFGDSSKVRVGDVAIAIGNPLGEEFAGSVTAGIISATNRTIQYSGATYRVLQTDAAINPGNSGGALCNEKGEVIGINSLKIGKEANAEGMGFAISINEAKNIVNSLVKEGRVKRPYLGVYGGTAVPEQNMGVKGAYISKIEPESGAAAAGIRPTDIIIALDDKVIEKFEDLSGIIEKHKVGDTIKCTIWRNGKIIKVNIVLTDIKNTQ